MDAFVARQPIFTKKLKIYGFELLFREDMTNVFPGTEGNEATSKLISDSFSISVRKALQVERGHLSTSRKNCLSGRYR